MIARADSVDAISLAGSRFCPGSAYRQASPKIRDTRDTYARVGPAKSHRGAVKTIVAQRCFWYVRRPS
jgi:hypothetical protein